MLEGNAPALPAGNALHNACHNNASNKICYRLYCPCQIYFSRVIIDLRFLSLQKENEILDMRLGEH